jgi:hypothetical protein
LPSVGKKHSTKSSLPSVKKTLGKELFAECQKIKHSAKKLFAECQK